MNQHQGRREAILLAYRVINGNSGGGSDTLLKVARWIYYGDEAPVPYLPTPYGLGDMRRTSPATGTVPYTVTNGSAS